MSNAYARADDAWNRANNAQSSANNAQSRADSAYSFANRANNNANNRVSWNTFNAHTHKVTIGSGSRDPVVATSVNISTGTLVGAMTAANNFDTSTPN